MIDRVGRTCNLTADLHLFFVLTLTDSFQIVSGKLMTNPRSLSGPNESFADELEGYVICNLRIHIVEKKQN